MKHLKYYFTLSFSMLLVFGLVIPALAQGEKKEDLIGHWTLRMVLNWKT